MSHKSITNNTQTFHRSAHFLENSENTTFSSGCFFLCSSRQVCTKKAYADIRPRGFVSTSLARGMILEGNDTIMKTVVVKLCKCPPLLYYFQLTNNNKCQFSDGLTSVQFAQHHWRHCKIRVLSQVNFHKVHWRALMIKEWIHLKGGLENI